MHNFPNELIFQVLLETNRSCHNHWKSDIYKNYVNQYTPIARILRRVCRRWRNLIDLPSSSEFRVTILALKLEMDVVEIQDKDRDEEIYLYHDSLYRSNSMLAIHYTFSRYYSREGFSLDLHTITIIMDALDELQHFRSKLLRLEFHFDDHTFVGYTLRTLDALIAACSRLTSLVLKGAISLESPPDDDRDLGIILPGDQELHSRFQWPTPSLRREKLLSSASQWRSKLFPSSLRHIELSGSLSELITLLREFGSISKLTTRLTPTNEPPAVQDNLTPLHMDSLQSLTIASTRPLFIKALSILQCANLSRLEFESNLSHMDDCEPTEDMPDLPNLKHLVLKHVTATILSLILSYFKNGPALALQSLIIDAFEPHSSFMGHPNLDGVWASDCNWRWSDDGIKVQSLRIVNPDNGPLPLLLTLIRPDSIEVFMRANNVMTVNNNVKTFQQDTPTTLSILALDLKKASRLLNYARGVKSLNSLEIITPCYKSYNPAHLAKTWTAWTEFVFSAFSDRSFESMTRMQTSWQPSFQSDLGGFNQTLFYMCPNVSEFTLKRIPSSVTDWPLPELKITPQFCKSFGNAGVFLTSLKSIVLEFDYECEFEDFSSKLRVYEKEFSFIQELRRRAGASPIQALTLRSFSDTHEVEREELMLPNGLLLCFEIQRKREDMFGSIQ